MNIERINRFNLMDIDELALLLKTSPVAIYRRLSRGTLPLPFRLGGKDLFWHKDDICDWIAEQREKHLCLPRVKLGRPRKGNG